MVDGANLSITLISSFNDDTIIVRPLRLALLLSPTTSPLSRDGSP